MQVLRSIKFQKKNIFLIFKDFNVPEASEPTKSGTAEPKVEEKTEDKDVPDASAQRAEKPTLAAPATPAAKVDFVDCSEEVESVEWSRFKV